MSQSLLSAELLLGCRLRSADGAGAGLTGLLLDTEQWSVQFLAVDAQRCALDRAGETLHLGVSSQQLRDAPQAPLPVTTAPEDATAHVLSLSS